MTPEERRDLIAKYAAGYDEVINALDGFPADSLGAHPIPGKWSAREIVHHLGDSETFSAGRLRKLLVEDNPTIQGYDQDQFAVKLRYNERDMEPALEAFRLARETTMQLLYLMTEDDWKRAGTHTESGRYTTEDWLTIYAKHAHNQPPRFVDCVNRWRNLTTDDTDEYGLESVFIRVIRGSHT